MNGSVTVNKVSHYNMMGRGIGGIINSWGKRNASQTKPTTNAMTYRELQQHLKQAKAEGKIPANFKLNQKKDVLQAKWDEISSSQSEIDWNDYLKGRYIDFNGRKDPVKYSCERIQKAWFNTTRNCIEAKVVSSFSKEKFTIWITPSTNVVDKQGNAVALPCY